MPTDLSEKGLEDLIYHAMVGRAPAESIASDRVAEAPAYYGGTGYEPGDPADFNREYAVDQVKLLQFLEAIQPHVVQAFDLHQDGIQRRKFLARLQSETTRRGIVDVLREGIEHHPHRWTSSTAPPPRAMFKLENASTPTFSASPASSATAATRPGSPWTSASSSTGCRWPPSSCRTG